MFILIVLSRIFSIILHCSIDPCFWEGGCCMSNFSFIILHCSVIPYYWEKTTLPLFTPLGRGDFICVYIYILFFQESLLPSVMSVLFHTFRKCHSTTHSILKGLSSLYFSIVSSIILHYSIKPCFWEGGCCMSNFPFIILHCSVIPYYWEKTTLPLFTPLRRGDFICV